MKEKMICRGDLFYYDFGDNSGSVQSGERPVLVIQADDYNQNAPTIIVAAVTSVIKKRYLPSHIILGEEFGLKKPSMVLLEQIRTVNREDLREYIGMKNHSDTSLYILTERRLAITDIQSTDTQITIDIQDNMF